MEIRLDNLAIGYATKKDKKVVKSGIHLTLESGAVTCLLGLNGVGKSTLIRTICGFQKPIAGSITINGKDISSYSNKEIARMIGVVLTDKTFAGGLTVKELVSLGRHPHTGFFGHLSGKDETVVENSLAAADISNKSQRLVSELSDGERQKVMIAKTLAQECPVMILDEPTAFLDAASRIETLALLCRLAREQDKAILISTHDIDNAIKMADRLWLMGENLETISGTPRELIDNNLFARYFENGRIVFDREKETLVSIRQF